MIGARSLLVLGTLASARARELDAQRVEIPGRACALQSSGLPRLETLIDSTAAFEGLAALPQGTWGQVVITLTFSPAGEARQARVLATDLPDSIAAPVVRAVAGAVRDLAESGLAGVRLLVNLGGTAGLKVEPAVYCAPEPEGPGGPLHVDVTSTTPGPARVQMPAQRILVGEDGAVRTVELAASSGQPDLDQAVLDRARRQRFKPGLVDGIPVAIWIRRP